MVPKQADGNHHKKQRVVEILGFGFEQLYKLEGFQGLCDFGRQAPLNPKP